MIPLAAGLRRNESLNKESNDRERDCQAHHGRCVPYPPDSFNDAKETLESIADMDYGLVKIGNIATKASTDAIRKLKSILDQHRIYHLLMVLRFFIHTLRRPDGE